MTAFPEGTQTPWVKRWVAHVLLKEYAKFLKEGDDADAAGDSATAVDKWKDSQEFLSMARNTDSGTVERFFDERS